jgi:hypothetical protein
VLDTISNGVEAMGPRAQRSLVAAADTSEPGEGNPFCQASNAL